MTHAKALLALAVLMSVCGATWFEHSRLAALRPHVWVEPIARRSLVRTVLAPASVVPDGSITVSTDISSRVSRLRVRVGQVVARGTPLAELDVTPVVWEVERAAREAAARASEAEAASFEATRQEHVAHWRRQASNRAQISVAQGLVPRSDAERARAEAEVAEAEHRQGVHRHAAVKAAALAAHVSLGEARDRLNRVAATSPIEGVVAAVMAYPGQLVTAATRGAPPTPLVSLTRRTPLLEAALPETALAQVDGETHVVVTITALPGLSRSGHVVAVTPPPRSTALVDLDDPPKGLRVGMSANAVFTLDERANALAVPTHALRHAPSKGRATGRPRSGGRSQQDGHDTSQAWVVRSGLVARVSVAAGMKADGYTEVRSGLAEGDAVITGPQSVLRSIGVGDAVVALRAPITADAR